jgi:hypothetical protein
MAYTVQNLIDRVSADLHDTRATRRWTDEAIIDFVNDGSTEIMMIRPESTSDVVDFATVVGVRQELAETSYRLLDILHNGTIAIPGGAVRQVDLEELDSYTPNWRTATATATALEFTWDENDSRGFYVLPPSIAASDLTILVSVYPTAMTAVSDTLDIRDEYFTALQYYVCWRALNQDFEFTESNRAENFYNKFLAALKMKDGGDNVSFPATDQVTDRTT